MGGGVLGKGPGPDREQDSDRCFSRLHALVKNVSDAEAYREAILKVEWSQPGRTKVATDLLALQALRRAPTHADRGRSGQMLS